MSERSQPRSKINVPGSRVTLREDAFRGAQPHPRAHAMHRDVGTVVDRRRTAWPERVLVRSDDCGMVHRLAEHEIVLAEPSAS